MTELTNLLPPERIAQLKREYFMRLATMTILALSGVFIASGALLIPSYLYLDHRIQLGQNRLKELDASLTASNGKEETARLAALTSTASYLARLATTTPPTAALRGVLGVPRPGIALTGITYTPPVKGPDGRMNLTGVAATRETLRAYSQALGTLPYVSNVDLPISAFAKENSIPFTIALTGTLSP